jgi:thiol-disulfide isomerase/thioredoxin
MISFISKIFFPVIFLAVGVNVAFAQNNTSPDAVKTIIIKASDLKSLVKSPENKQPILLNFWATWCGPCGVEFPDLVEIDRDFREKGLSFYVVSIDNPSLVNTRVSDFLKSYEAEMPSYLLDISSSSQMTRAIRQIYPKFTGGFPLTLLFNSNGKLIYQKNGRINDQTLRSEIKKVLPKSDE